MQLSLTEQHRGHDQCATIVNVHGTHLGTRPGCGSPQNGLMNPGLCLSCPSRCTKRRSWWILAAKHSKTKGLLLFRAGNLPRNDSVQRIFLLLERHKSGIQHVPTNESKSLNRTPSSLETGRKFIQPQLCAPWPHLRARLPQKHELWTQHHQHWLKKSRFLDGSKSPGFGLCTGILARLTNQNHPHIIAHHCPMIQLLPRYFGPCFHPKSFIPPPLPPTPCSAFKDLSAALIRSAGSIRAAPRKGRAAAPTSTSSPPSRTGAASAAAAVAAAASRKSNLRRRSMPALAMMSQASEAGGQTWEQLGIRKVGTIHCLIL